MQTRLIFLTYPPFKLNAFDTTGPWYPSSEKLYILKQNIVEYIYILFISYQVILFLSGRKFNKHGELTKDWWDSDSLKHFKKRADCVEKQYSNYKVRGKYKVRLFDKIIFA